MVDIVYWLLVLIGTIMIIAGFLIGIIFIGKSKYKIVDRCLTIMVIGMIIVLIPIMYQTITTIIDIIGG